MTDSHTIYAKYYMERLMRWAGEKPHKPRIYWDGVLQRWVCKSAAPELAWWSGHGHTPAQAFTNWVDSYDVMLRAASWGTTSRLPPATIDLGVQYALPAALNTKALL